MKIKGMDGEFGFRALVMNMGHELILSPGYYLTREQVINAHCDGNFIWPVEVYENGVVYIPSEEELQEDK